MDFINCGHVMVVYPIESYNNVLILVFYLHNHKFSLATSLSTTSLSSLTTKIACQRKPLFTTYIFFQYITYLVSDFQLQNCNKYDNVAFLDLDVNPKNFSSSSTPVSTVLNDFKTKRTEPQGS